MNAKDAIKYSLDSNFEIMKTFLNDLSDADLLVRPVPGANHAAWQIGHLIASEVGLLAGAGGIPAPLPAGFAEKHSKATASIDSPSAFLTKAQYLDLYDKVRAATLASLDKLAEADLDKASAASIAAYAPTVAIAYLIMGSHIMMHAGQFTVLRRKLGKPVLF